MTMELKSFIYCIRLLCISTIFSYPADKSPRAVEDPFIGQANKVLDPIANDSGESGRAADQVQWTDNPACPEECSWDVVSGKALAKRVLCGDQILALVGGEVERWL